MWLGLGLALLGACATDREARSGGDAYRHVAAPMALGEWVTDDVDESAGDRTDWKAIEVVQSCQVVVQLRVDEPDTELLVAAFSRFGEPLGRVERREGVPLASFGFEAARVGRFFLMIRATEGPPSSYTLRATMGEPSGTGDGIRPDF